MKKTLLIAMFYTLVFAQVVHAEEGNINVGLTFGTTGANIELSKSVNDYVGLRLNARVGGDLNLTTRMKGNEYKANLTPDTKSLLLDVYPFGGVFYLTGGLVKQGINFKLTGQAAAGGTYTFNSVTYNQSDVGSFTGTASFSKSTAPYLGLGWSNRNKKRSGLAFSFEAGVMSTGAGKVSLDVSCGSSLSTTACSTLQGNVSATNSSINSDFDKNLYYPVILLGMSYRF